MWGLIGIGNPMLLQVLILMPRKLCFFYEMSLLRTLVSKTTCKLRGVGSGGINRIWSLNPQDNLVRVSIKWKTLVKFRT
jgi:hypothetical protein